ncbi:MAG: hypothetical protein ACI8P0_003066 [Planctomycetaceae bacterium]|jgi:hypothetical protein
MMTTSELPKESDRFSVPAAVEELCFLQDSKIERIRSAVDSVSTELSDALDREERLELASGIGDIAEELHNLIQRKLDAGFYDGFKGANRHSQERVAHLISDYRRLLSELRTARHETAAGKPRKAQRELTSWLGHFSDLVDRETSLIDELWNTDF